MSSDLSFSVELAAERSSERYYLEKKLQKYGLFYSPLEKRLEKFGLKHFPSNTLINSLTSLRNDAYNILDALIETGYKYYNGNEYFKISDDNLSSALNLLDFEDSPNNYLNVFRKLKEKLDYKTVNISFIEQLFQIDIIFKMSRFKGDVCRAIDLLAEIGYSLRTFKGKKRLLYEELDIIRDLAQVDADNFLKTFYKLKEKLGYKTIHVRPSNILGSNSSSRDQIGKIIEVSKLGNVCEAIEAFSGWRNLDVNAYGKDNSLHAGGLRIEKKVDKMPPWGIMDVSRDFKKYKIDKKKGITYKDVEIINYISDGLWEKSLGNIKSCFYKESSEKFIDFFKSLSADEKKRVIKVIFNCNKTNNQEITEWLDKNEPELVREVGLSLV